MMGIMEETDELKAGASLQMELGSWSCILVKGQLSENKNPIKLLSQAKRRDIKPKDVGGVIFGNFSHFDKCHPEAGGDFISSMAVEQVGADVRAKFGVSVLNRGQII